MKQRLTLMLCCMLLILSGCTQQYKRISFNADAQLEELRAQYIDDKTEISVTADGVFPSQIPIYEISERNITNEEFEIMKQNFEIPNSAPGQSICMEGNEIFGMILPTSDISAGCFDMTDEELEKAAWEIFEKLPFITGEYKYMGIVAKHERGDSSGTYVTRVGVSFRKHLDGIRILGDDECVLYLDGSGRLVEAYIKLYEYKNIGSMDVIPVDEASLKISNPDRLGVRPKEISLTSSVFATMQVEEIVPILMNQYSDGCTILQPVYSFVGTATDDKGVESKFNSWVIAIPESYTYEEDT